MPAVFVTTANTAFGRRDSESVIVWEAAGRVPPRKAVMFRTSVDARPIMIDAAGRRKAAHPQARGKAMPGICRWKGFVPPSRSVSLAGTDLDRGGEEGAYQGA